MTTLTVLGPPAPQGSKRALINKCTGRAVMTESSAKVTPWREAVKFAWALHGSTLMFQGPVCIGIVFTLPKPKSAPKTRRTYPDKKPDIDKLVRSTLDALVQAGAIEDDARIVRLTAAKVFPNEGDQSLHVPGAVITIAPVAQEQENHVPQ